MTSEGKLCVCNDICENLAKFHKIKKNKSYLDCLKFFQSTLSSGQSLGLKRMVTDVDFARSGGEVPLNNNLRESTGEYQVAEKTECLSIDYI